MQKPIPTPRLKPGDVVRVSYRINDRVAWEYLVGVARRVRKTYIVLDLYRETGRGMHVATDSMELHSPVQRFRIPQAELRYVSTSGNDMMSEYTMEREGYGWVFSVAIPICKEAPGRTARVGETAA